MSRYNIYHHYTETWSCQTPFHSRTSLPRRLAHCHRGQWTPQSTHLQRRWHINLSGCGSCIHHSWDRFRSNFEHCHTLLVIVLGKGIPILSYMDVCVCVCVCVCTLYTCTGVCTAGTLTLQPQCFNHEIVSALRYLPRLTMRFITQPPSGLVPKLKGVHLAHATSLKVHILKTVIYLLFRIHVSYMYTT